jgi:hypothetical protein
MTSIGPEESTDMSTDDPFERAVRSQETQRHERRMQLTRKSFRIHLVVFALVQLLLFVTWLLTTPGGFPWFVFPFLGWGIGLGVHGYVAYADR